MSLLVYLITTTMGAIYFSMRMDNDKYPLASFVYGAVCIISYLAGTLCR